MLFGDDDGGVGRDLIVLRLCDRTGPFGNDFTRFIDKSLNNVIFVDDANQFEDRLITILDELNTTQKNVKIILTVRDCFLNDIKTICNNYSESKILTVKQFTDEQLKSFLKNEFGIKRLSYVRQITTISEGNPRLAYYAAKMLIDKNDISSIYNTEQLFDTYYSNYLNSKTMNLYQNNLQVRNFGREVL